MEPTIKITAVGNGHYNIESGCPGPATTIQVLRDVIVLLERAAVKGEMDAAKNAVAVPSADLQQKLLSRGAINLGGGNGEGG